MSDHVNLLGEPPATLLPPLAEAEALIASGTSPVDVAAKYPAFSLAWALLAESALDGGRPVEAYAYARTGYHRGLDALRRNGWKGHGPVPWSHEPNQGFLRCLAALGTAAGDIGERDEEQRCWTFLADSSKEAYAALRH
jgi:hypothetical protein